MSTQGPGLLPLLTDEQRQVFGELYRSNFSRVLSQCRWLLRSPDDAADAAHEVFVKAIGGLQPGASPEAARAWLLTVARNHCLDVLRRRHRLGKAMLSVQASRESDVDPEMAIVDRQVVGSIFRQLRLRERQALWQSAVEGRPLAEIATDLRLSYVAAAQLLHRARRRAASLAGKVAAWVGLVQMARVARRATLVGSGSRHVLAAADAIEPAVRLFVSQPGDQCWGSQPERSVFPGGRIPRSHWSAAGKWRWPDSGRPAIRSHLDTQLCRLTPGPNSATALIDQTGSADQFPQPPGGASDRTSDHAAYSVANSNASRLTPLGSLNHGRPAP